MSIRSQLSDVRETLPEGVTLVAVSKTHAPALIEEAYAAGQRIFGESRPQELAAKYEALPKDIEWHMIGHLQTNKVKLIAPFVALIHSADSERLIRVINDEAIRNGRVIDILLEIHVADEETKSGWTYDALLKYVKSGALAAMKGVRVRGVMGIATYTSNEFRVRLDFELLQQYKRSWKRISTPRSTRSRWACRTTIRWRWTTERRWYASGRSSSANATTQPPKKRRRSDLRPNSGCRY